MTLIKNSYMQAAPGDDSGAAGEPPASDPPEVNWGAVDDSLTAADELDAGTASSATGEPPATDPPVVEPPVVPPVVPPVTPPVVAPPQKTQEQITAEVEAARAELHGHLTQRYAADLTEEDKQALMADPATVIPKMLAQATMDAVAMAMREFHNMLPQAVTQQVTTGRTVENAWGAFYKANADLAKPEYRQAIVAAANTLKQSGQKLSQEQAMKLTAKTARAMLDLPEPTPGKPAAVTTRQPAAAPVAPHTPVARGNASSRVPAPKAGTDNTWEQFLD